MKFRILIIFLCALTLFAFSGEKSNQHRELLRKVRQYRQAREPGILREFFQLLSIPNVSKDKGQIIKNAHHIKQMMEKRRIEVQILETEGNPVVYGELQVPGASQTLLFYVHYDGQPVDRTKWIDSGPFEPVLRAGKLDPLSKQPKPQILSSVKGSLKPDWRIYARSASDDKAPILAILTALDALYDARIPLRNNIKFILDGEEEAGSRNLPAFCRKYKDLLAADILFMCDGPCYFSGDPTLFFGVRGITTLEITLYGANTNLHSGHFGNWAPNPAMRLAQLLATFKGPDGRVVIKDFYNSTFPLSKREKQALKEIQPFDKELQTLYGFTDRDMTHLSLMEAIQLPSLNVRGLKSAWIGSQARTVIPAQATASIDIRLVKGNQPGDMTQKVMDHIRSLGFYIIDKDPDQKVRMTHPLLAKIIRSRGYPASRTSMDLPIVKRVVQTFNGYFKKPPVLLPTLGGSLPIYIFTDTLNIPVIGVSIANHDNNQHQANENLRIGNLWRGIETFAALIMLADSE